MKSKMFRAVLVKENDLEYWIIASGAFKASEMKFKTKKQAEDYINKIDWDMIITAISQVLNFNEQKKKKLKFNRMPSRKHFSPYLINF